jgi:hypothetical protein
VPGLARDPTAQRGRRARLPECGLFDRPVVVWLNELQGFLGPNGQGLSLDVLRDLYAAAGDTPVVLVGTLWRIRPLRRTARHDPSPVLAGESGRVSAPERGQSAKWTRAAPPPRRADRPGGAAAALLRSNRDRCHQREPTPAIVTVASAQLVIANQNDPNDVAATIRITSRPVQ